MEVSGIVFRPLPCFSGCVGVDTQSTKLSKNVELLGHGDHFKSNICLRSRKVMNNGFSDGGHVDYYASLKAGLKEKEKKVKKNPETASLKKKLKLIKGMSKDLLKFSSMGFGVEAEDGLIAEVKGKKISEATEILLSQLQQLKAEEKELKRKKKEEKAKLKTICESSSSSSSDSECGEVIDMSSLRNGAMDKPIEVPVQEISTSPNNRNQSTDTSTSCNNVMVEASEEKIEVCMGGKCKKSGAPALLEEFQQRVGIEGAVVGCKCMGKCRDGPNVRIAKKLDAQTQTSPLCIGVGLEDVGVIVGNFFGGQSKDLGFMVA